MSDEVLISTDYILVIDTDQYAGNFAEDLVSYCTGFYGEDTREQVRDLSNLFYVENGIEDGGEGEEDLLANDKNPFVDFIVDQQDDVGNWNPCAVWPSRKYGVNSSGEYAVLTDKNYNDYNFPAGYSVGIYMSAPLDEPLLSLVKERAVKFFEQVYPKLAKEGEKNVKVEGFRLIVHTKTAKEMAV